MECIYNESGVQIIGQLNYFYSFLPNNNLPAPSPADKPIISANQSASSAVLGLRRVPCRISMTPPKRTSEINTNFSQCLYFTLKVVSLVY